MLYCEGLGECALPACSKVVAQYIRKMSDGKLKSNTIRIGVAAIATIHKLNELPDPTQH